MPTVGPSSAPNNAKNPTSRGQVLGTNSVDFIDLNAITSTAALPYNARGNGGNDTVYGNNFDNDLYGDAGDDNVIGRSGNDRVDGGAGNDTLIGDQASFVVVGPGNVVYTGDDNGAADGNDTLLGGAGNDTAWGGGGNDYIPVSRVQPCGCAPSAKASSLVMA